MPVNWYAALVVIVLVGVASIAFAKYHYDQNPPVVEPTTNTTWHAALAFDICGTMQPALPASPTGGTTGLTTSGEGVLVIAPKSASEAGNNATLGKFAEGYSGLTLTNTSLKYPSSHVPEYRNGQKCAVGTPDAGKVGEVQARTWILSTSTSNGEEKEVGGLTTVHPADLKFANRQIVTVGFVPSNTELPKPPSSTILALVQTLSGTQPAATTTTTTAAGATTTTSSAVSTTTTTAPATTTTKASTTTTTK